MQKNIVTIIGARPQFVKAAIVSRQIQQMTELKEIVVHTGQHYDANMSEVFFDELEMAPPSYNLEIGSSSHGAQTGQMLTAIEQVLLKEKPKAVLIYGDTNSTLAGAIAASKLHIPVFHVEAGLRSFNMKMPEEINRIVSDRLSSLLFAPTQTAVDNLMQEGTSADKVHLVGDVMYDVALYFGQKAEKVSNILNTLGLKDKPYLLTTIHRAENTDDTNRLSAIFNGLMQVAKDFPVVLPLHPRTRHALDKSGLLDQVLQQLTILEPLGFLDMLQLEKQAQLIVTDSGGVQKEAFFHETPCVTLRDETEWLELVELGWNTLVKPDNANSIVKALVKQLNANPPSTTAKPYGSGDSAAKITELICKFIYTYQNNSQKDIPIAV